jgi:hypothetical protein
MKVKFLDNCRAAGEHFSIGDEADLPEGIAKQLIAIGRAKSPEIAEVHDYASDSSEPPEPKPAPPKRAATKPAAPKED